MLCPILPITDVTTALPVERSFVERLQMALKDKAQQMGQPAWDPGPITGIYGPETARALDTYQRTLPLDTAADLLLRLTGRGYAACATYRSLGLPCDAAVPVIGVTGSDEVVAAMMLALSRQFGQPRIPCSQAPPSPPAPPPPAELGGTGWRLLLWACGIGAGVWVVWHVAREAA